jgi:hypothetical protein
MGKQLLANLVSSVLLEHDVDASQELTAECAHSHAVGGDLCIIDQNILLDT